MGFAAFEQYPAGIALRYNMAAAGAVLQQCRHGRLAATQVLSGHEPCLTCWDQATQTVILVGHLRPKPVQWAQHSAALSSED